MGAMGLVGQAIAPMGRSYKRVVLFPLDERLLEIARRA